MSLYDTKIVKIPKMPPKPAVGKSYFDPIHNVDVYRVTSSIEDGHPAEVPPYSNRPTAQTKKHGNMFLLYLKGPNAGHRFYSAEPPFPRIVDIPWGKYAPDEAESVWCAGSIMYWMTYIGDFWCVDLDGGAPQLLFSVRSPTNEVFGDTHGLPSLDGTRGCVSWYVSELEKRLAVFDLRERRLLWEMPYLTPRVTGFQKRTGTPMMALDGQFFAVPFPRTDGPGVYFWTFRINGADVKAERILVADYTYEHSCQAQIPNGLGGMLDVYLSRTNGAGKNPSTWIPSRETEKMSFALLSSFETNLKETAARLPGSLPQSIPLGDFMPLFSQHAWGPSSGTHLTGGCPGHPSRIAFSCFAPSNKDYRYDGGYLACGHQEITIADLEVAIPTRGMAGFQRVAFTLGATQASEAPPAYNPAYWCEPHLMFIAEDAVAWGSDYNFHLPQAQWTPGIDTWAAKFPVTSITSIIGKGKSKKS